MDAKTLVSVADQPLRLHKGIIIMFIRLELAQRAAVSVVAALVFAAVAISAAVPVVPIA